MRERRPPSVPVLIERKQDGDVTKTVVRHGPYTFHTTVTVGPETVSEAAVEQYIIGCLVRRWPEIRRKLREEAEERGEDCRGEKGTEDKPEE